MAGSRSGAFMTEGPWQSQPTRVANKQPQGTKLPLSGTHDTSWPMNDRDRKPRFRRGGGKGPDRGPESGRRPPWRGRDGSADDTVILYGWHTVAAALANPQRRIRKLLVTENAARRLADDKIDTRVTPEIVRPTLIDQ